MAQVIVVGSYVQDHAWLVERFPRPGETRRAHGFNTGPGGKGFNQAVACHRQGVPTAYIGAIGADHLGAIAQEFARAEGLPCRWQIRQDASTAASSIVVNAQGENQIAVSFAANEHLDPDFVRAQDALFAAAKIVLVQAENNLDAIAAALDVAECHQLLRVFNPAPAVPEIDAALLRRANVITPNETEFALLYERIAGTALDAATLAARTTAELHELARTLGVATVVVTLGAHGCFVSHGADRRGDEQAHYRLPVEAVRTIDTTGAGDAFSGALVAALARFGEAPFHRAIEHANRAAALSTETIGTAPAMPTFEAVTKRFGPI
ncbi:MAG TPA: ribokinase [Rudaea sp.]|nr:ribokinase [Rudaea sp.]